MAQAQVQAEHSSAEGRLQTWPSVGFLPFAFCSLAEPGAGAGCVSLSSCLMTPAQAVAGLKLAKRKKRHKIDPAWCASCKGLLRLGHGQPRGVGSVGSGGGIEMGGKAVGGTTTGEGL